MAAATQIAFHFNAPDKLDYACRFARKALRREVRLAIVAPMEVLRALSVRLWKQSGHDFLAHAIEGDEDAQFGLAPIVLVEQPAASVHTELLLNLGATVPEGFERFSKLVEVVSSFDEADRAAARQRWRQYQVAGYALERHDLVLQGAGA